MNHKISLFSIFFLIVLAFIFPSIVQAGSGCCGVVLPHTSAPQYQTTTSEQCATLNAGYAGSNYIFEEGKVAAKDAKTCTDGQVVAEEAKSTKPITPKLQVSIPGFVKFSDVTCDDPDIICEFPWIGEYIKAIYDYGLAVVGILSIIVMMIGGIIRLTAAGNHAQISQGNTYIKSSILGVVFTLCSYMILFIVNPNLTILKPINVSYQSYIELSEIEQAIANHGLPPESGLMAASCSESEWITVPNDKNLGIWTPKPEKSCPDSVAALKAAAQCMKAMDPDYIIRVSDASRTMDEQRYHWKRYKEGKGNLACNPANGPTGCPHTGGQAFDAFGCLKNDDGKCKSAYLQEKLQTCMFRAGFCLLTKECWHFENPQLSRACEKIHNQNGGRDCPK